MTDDKRWQEAQKTELDFWQGMARSEFTVLAVVASNAQRVPLILANISRPAETCLEIGGGPFGLGIVGFLPQIPNRFVMDPLAPLPLVVPEGEDGFLADFLQKKRAPLSHVVARGEEIPLASNSVDLVICSNVLDHVSDPDSVLQEALRVLKPLGEFFVEVDAFSLLGLLKWHAWTKHVRKDEILVRAHPHRFRQSTFVRKLRSAGFNVREVSGHSSLSNLMGHARPSAFVAQKPAVS